MACARLAVFGLAKVQRAVEKDMYYGYVQSEDVVVRSCIPRLLRFRASSSNEYTKMFRPTRFVSDMLLASYSFDVLELRSQYDDYLIGG